MRLQLQEAEKARFGLEHHFGHPLARIQVYETVGAQDIWGSALLASACGCRGSAPRHWDDERLEKLLQLQLLAYIKSGRRLQAAIVERWKQAGSLRLPRAVMSFRLEQPRQALKWGGQILKDDAGVKIDAWLAEIQSACAAQKGRSPLLRDLGQDGVDAEPLPPPLARHRQGPRIPRTCPSKAPAWGSSFASPPPSKRSRLDQSRCLSASRFLRHLDQL
jgi:hypothetical protein